MDPIVCRCGHIFRRGGFALIPAESMRDLRDLATYALGADPKVFKCPSCEGLTVLWVGIQQSFYKRVV